MKHYRPTDKITLDGIEYEIAEVMQHSTLEGGVLHVTTKLRTLPAPEMIEVTITTPRKRR